MSSSRMKDFALNQVTGKPDLILPFSDFYSSPSVVRPYSLTVLLHLKVVPRKGERSLF